MDTDIEDPPLFPFLLLSCSLGDIEIDTVLKKLKLEDLTKKFQTEHITPDIVRKLSVHEMEMLGINSRSDMMSGEKHRRNSRERGVLPFSLFHSQCLVICYKRDLQSRKYLRSLLYQRVRFNGG